MFKDIWFVTRDYGELTTGKSELLLIFHMATEALNFQPKAWIWDKYLINNVQPSMLDNLQMI